MHQHHHHHDHDHEREEFEQPLDAANQSLSDALRASFGILKGIMLVLVGLYLFSNVRGIESHEEALILRLGRLHRVVDEPGLVWAWPYPIDEIVRLPTKKSNLVTVDSHTFRRRPQDEGKPLSMISPSGSGLNPEFDFALLTADAGLVHVRWNISYKISDVEGNVSRIAGATLIGQAAPTRQIEAAEALLATLVENVGIHVALNLTAEEVIRTRVDYVQEEMSRRLNQRLRDLQSGIVVESVEMFEPTPPLQVRSAFDQAQKAENDKEKRIRHAEQERTSRLSDAAGSEYQRLVQLLDTWERAQTPEARRALDEALVEAEGRVGKLIEDAGAYQAVVVGQMESDVREYRTLLPEFKRNSGMLVERLWQDTWLKILRNPEVIRMYVPQRTGEFRVVIPFDEEQSRVDERRRLQQDREFDPDSLRPKHWVPVGPEYD